MSIPDLRFVPLQQGSLTVDKSINTRKARREVWIDNSLLSRPYQAGLVQKQNKKQGMGEAPERYRNMIYWLVGMVFYSLLCLFIFHLID
jgi:hypothetical protein